MSLESIRARKTKDALDFQRRISLIEIFSGEDKDQVLIECGEKPDEISREVPHILEMIERNPLLVRLNRGGHA